MESVSKSIIWNTVGSTVYLGALWLLNILVVRFGDYSEAGILSLAISIANVVQSIALAGIRNYQVSDVKNQYSNYTYIITRYITSFIGIMGCIIFIGINRYNLYQSICIMSMSLYRIIDALIDVYHGILQKKWRLDIVGKALAIRGVGCVIIFTVILGWTQNLFYAIIGMIIVSILIFVILELPQTKKTETIDRNINLKGIKALIIYAIPLTVYTTLLNSISVTTRYYIELICGESALGYYASIASPALIVQVAATYIFSPLIGLFANLYEQKIYSKFKTMIVKCFGIILIVILVAIIACQFLGDWGLKLLFGEKILAYNYLLLPIVFSTALTAVVLFLSMLLTVVRSLKELVFANMIGFIFNLCVSPWAIKRYSMQGANYILIISLLIDAILLLIFIRKKLIKQ